VQSAHSPAAPVSHGAAPVAAETMSFKERLQLFQGK
jgi:hypothetical protein